MSDAGTGRCSRIRPVSRAWFAVFGAIVLLGSCGGSDGPTNEQVSELEAELESLREQLEATTTLPASTSTSTSTTTTTEPPTTLAPTTLPPTTAPPTIPPTTAPPTTPAPILRTISGEILLLDDVGGPAGKTCWGSGGYDDIGAGATVTVRNDRGDIVGVGSLGGGVAESAGPPIPGPIEPIEIFWCNLPILPISGIPDAPFYTVEVSHRGEVTFSNADLAASGWRVELSLG